MKQSYRKAYLTDGTQVKITEGLYQQFRQWEQAGYHIPFEYTDMLKREDNEMINTSRNYYIHNISLDEQMLRDNINPALMHDKRFDIDEQILRKERNKLIIKILKLCTETQRRRFIKHYYLGFSQSQIAMQEQCCKKSVYESVVAVEKLLINCEQMK